MSKVIIGNHAAVRVPRSQREAIRQFYGDILGCKLMRAFSDKDDFGVGDDYYIAFLYASGRGVDADQGVPYAPDDMLSDDEFLKATFLELKAEDVEDLRRQIIAFGVRVLSVPDPHLYFQAPGGQVFRLAGIDEDLSKYEGTEPRKA